MSPPCKGATSAAAFRATICVLCAYVLTFLVTELLLGGESGRLRRRGLSFGSDYFRRGFGKYFLDEIQGNSGGQPDPVLVLLDAQTVEEGLHVLVGGAGGRDGRLQAVKNGQQRPQLVGEQRSSGFLLVKSFRLNMDCAQKPRRRYQNRAVQQLAVVGGQYHVGQTSALQLRRIADDGPRQAAEGERPVIPA